MRITVLGSCKPYGALSCFFQQFFNSVAKTDYFTLRHHFVSTHLSTNTSFNFQKYIQRSLDDDFKVVVGISPFKWLLVVIFLLVDVHGWNVYLCVSFLPLTGDGSSHMQLRYSPPLCSCDPSKNGTPGLKLKRKKQRQSSPAAADDSKNTTTAVSSVDSSAHQHQTPAMLELAEIQEESGPAVHIQMGSKISPLQEIRE
ncbi:hypothetical protein F3Y22_tig00000715pilonHSYRG00214 [Hibiscus syriacus]|uniref:Uncharacterized protein n=1 Tax=Hibiscus syriacus TaxID=106335 RepID=A0A6A3D2E7_HIBSY|nr:hypothetical protein F3Y22_tig00000715pilonHSYRG00214 [Hibiscus syriacus]